LEGTHRAREKKKTANQEPRRRSGSHRDPASGGGFTESKAPDSNLQNSMKAKRGESLTVRQGSSVGHRGRSQQQQAAVARAAAQ